MSDPWVGTEFHGSARCLNILSSLAAKRNMDKNENNVHRAEKWKGYLQTKLQGPAS